MSQDWLKASLLPKRCAEIFLAESVRDTWLFGGMFVYAREAEDFFFLINWKRAGDLMTIHTSPSLRAKSILTHQLPPPPPFPSTPCPRCPPLSRFFHLPFSAAWVGRTLRERCRKQESDLLNRETQSSKRGAHNSFFYSALKLMVHVW